MTFDEAVDVVVYLSDASDIMEQYEQESWSYENPRNATLKLLEELRKEYAPTIEMMPNEYEAYKYYKENPDNYANPLAQWILSLYEDVSGADDYGMYDGYDVDNQEDIIRIVHAWDYPELIKVVD